MEKDNKKIATLDNKSLIEEKYMVELPVKYTNKMTLMLHTEIATGEFKQKKFRFIASACNRGYRLEYDNKHLDFNTRDLVNILMNKMVELSKITPKKNRKRRNKR